MRCRNEGSAVVTDSCLRTALLTIRCLGRHGVRITTVDRESRYWHNLGGLSRYVRRRIVVPDNRTQPAAFAQAALKIAQDHDVLVPVGMHSIVPIAQCGSDLTHGVKVALPPFSAIERADDTRSLLRLARELRVPVPSTFELDDFPTLDALAEVVPFPAIVKIGVEAGLPPHHRYRIVRSFSQLDAAVRDLSRFTDRPVIQELIVGDALGFEALYDFSGSPVATFCHRRLREFPLSGGPSTYCESFHSPLVEEYGRRLLDALGWVGLAMVEFKIDSRSGEPRLMEINPRPWGSMELPIRAGIEFPWLAYQLARDGSVNCTNSAKDRVRLRFLVNDIQAALAAARQTRGFSDKLSILSSLIDPRVKEGVLTVRDPMPSLAYLMKGMQRFISGGPPPL